MAKFATGKSNLAWLTSCRRLEKKFAEWSKFIDIRKRETVKVII